MDELRNLMDLNEAAAELGIAPVTLRAAIKSGTLRARKFGNSWITTRAEVDRYRNDWLGRIGRPPSLPVVYGYVKWPNGAYGTHTLLLGSINGIDEKVRRIQREIATRAVDEGAWQLAEVIAKVMVDPRMRGFRVRGDPRVPVLIVDQEAADN